MKAKREDIVDLSKSVNVNIGNCLNDIDCIRQNMCKLSPSEHAKINEMLSKALSTVLERTLINASNN